MPDNFIGTINKLSGVWGIVASIVAIFVAANIMMTDISANGETLKAQNEVLAQQINILRSINNALADKSRDHYEFREAQKEAARIYEADRKETARVMSDVVRALDRINMLLARFEKKFDNP